MAKKATAKRASRRALNSTRSWKNQFKSLAIHVTEANNQHILAALRADRTAHSVFSHAACQPANLDPESAAKRILAHAFASSKMPALPAPKIDGIESGFKSLGGETVPLTGTRSVKFRQQVSGIPVFGSLICVDLDDHYELVSLNASMAEPNLRSYIARISPFQALKKIAVIAGYGRELPAGTPVLDLYRVVLVLWLLV